MCGGWWGGGGGGRGGSDVLFILSKIVALSQSFWAVRNQEEMAVSHITARYNCKTKPATLRHI